MGILESSLLVLVVSLVFFALSSFSLILSISLFNLLLSVSIIYSPGPLVPIPHQVVDDPSMNFRVGS